VQTEGNAVTAGLGFSFEEKGNRRRCYGFGERETLITICGIVMAVR